MFRLPCYCSTSCLRAMLSYHTYHLPVIFTSYQYALIRHNLVSTSHAVILRGATSFFLPMLSFCRCFSPVFRSSINSLSFCLFSVARPLTVQLCAQGLSTLGSLRVRVSFRRRSQWWTHWIPLQLQVRTIKRSMRGSDMTFCLLLHHPTQRSI